MFQIGQNPLCSDIEELNRITAREPATEALVLSLARHTNVNFFAQTWVAQLIANLAQRKEGLIVRDAYKSWTPSPLDRFTTNIDGVAALVYSHIMPRMSLENAKQEAVPTALYKALETKLKVTGKLEEAGQTRTFIAVDPDYSTPVEFSSSLGPESKFRNLVQDIMREFNYKFGERLESQRNMEIALHTFIYEVFQNTIEHGRYSKEGSLIPGLRYLRIRTYIDKIEELCHRAKGFPELERFISRHKDKKNIQRFMELSVSDGGQGIVSHYVNSNSKFAEDHDKRETLLHQLVNGRRSSKDKLSGVGLGLPNAMSALSEIRAFISLRTEEFWVYRDFNDTDKTEWAKIFYPVSSADRINRLNGTQFNVLISISV